MVLSKVIPSQSGRFQQGRVVYWCSSTSRCCCGYRVWELQPARGRSEQAKWFVLRSDSVPPHIIGVSGMRSWVCSRLGAESCPESARRRQSCWGWISKALFGDKAVLWGCTDGAQPRGTRLSKLWPLARKCWRGTGVFHYLGQLFGCTTGFLSH